MGDQPDHPQRRQYSSRVALIISKMSSYQTSEDSLITFFSGFNQVFLSCLLLNILVWTCLGVPNSIAGDTMDGDYDFEIKTVMDRTKNHSTFVAGLVALTLAAVVFVTVTKALHNYRRLNISELVIYVFSSITSKFI